MVGTTRGDAFRQRVCDLEGRKLTLRVVPRAGNDVAVQLTEDVHPRLGGVEVEMAWAAPCGKAQMALAVRRADHRPALAVERMHPHLVGAEVTRQRPLVASWREAHHVRVRRLLPVGELRARLDHEHLGVRRRAQRAIAEDRNHAERRRAVVGAEHPRAVRRDLEVRGVAERVGAADHLERAGGVQPERKQLASAAGVDKPVGRVVRHPADVHVQLDERQRLRVFEHHDPPALHRRRREGAVRRRVGH
mmetsp:Transcript_2821/g.7072  ORF Transcript_2821/g.7072 Transcript_2821/m.7072 type:complete len:248 (-) Transcript_2821:51-794(-)